MKRNEMTNSYSNYINKCFDNVGFEPTAIDYSFETEKIAYFLFSDTKSELYLNPIGNNKCRVSMWLANKYYNGNDKTSGQTHITTTDIAQAMETIKAFIEAKQGKALELARAV